MPTARQCLSPQEDVPKYRNASPPNGQHGNHGANAQVHAMVKNPEQDPANRAFLTNRENAQEMTLKRKDEEILATFVNHVRQAVTLPKSDVIFRLLTEVNQSQRPLKPRMTVLTNAES